MGLTIVVTMMGTREYVVVERRQQGITHNSNLPTITDFQSHPVDQSFRLMVFVHVMHVFSVASRAEPNLKFVVM